MRSTGWRRCRPSRDSCCTSFRCCGCGRCWPGRTAMSPATAVPATLPGQGTRGRLRGISGAGRSDGRRADASALLDDIPFAGICDLRRARVERDLLLMPEASMVSAASTVMEFFTPDTVRLAQWPMITIVLETPLTVTMLSLQAMVLFSLMPETLSCPPSGGRGGVDGPAVGVGVPPRDGVGLCGESSAHGDLGGGRVADEMIERTPESWCAAKAAMPPRERARQRRRACPGSTTGGCRRRVSATAWIGAAVAVRGAAAGGGGTGREAAARGRRRRVGLTAVGRGRA